MPTLEDLYQEWCEKLPDAPSTRALIINLYTQVCDSKPAGVKLALGTLAKWATFYACANHAERLAVVQNWDR